MNWRRRLTEHLIDHLRFVPQACMQINLLILSLASVWMTLRFTWRLVQWVDQLLFSRSWTP